MKEAMFWKKHHNMINCQLCPRECSIADGKTGFCRVRKALDGKLYSLNYCRLTSVNVDPIEKKPFFHFAPGSHCLSIATVGCNLGCKFCQNWEISQSKEIHGEKLTPRMVVDTAVHMGLPGIAYTYVEPTVFYEFALSTMKLAREEGLYNVWVTNGYTSKKAIDKMSRYLDAANVDYKGDANFYKNLCLVPDPQPIKDAIKRYKKKGVWVEITNLLVPGWNDKPSQVKEMCEWIAKEVGKETPLHISRFFPHYKMKDIKPTPKAKLEAAYEIAKKSGLEYVYVGNIPNDKESTFCPKCGNKVIEREGFSVGIVTDKCQRCGHTIKMGKQRV